MLFPVVNFHKSWIVVILTTASMLDKYIELHYRQSVKDIMRKPSMNYSLI